MITPEDIRNKALKVYEKKIRKAYLTNGIEEVLAASLFGKQGNSKTTHRDLTDGVLLLREGSKASLGYGYSLEEISVNHARYGRQTRIERVYFETLGDWLRLIGKETEFERFQQAVALIRQQEPTLEDWLLRYPHWVAEYLDSWPLLLRVCAYIIENPASGLYLRELPIAEVHTKFIQRHLGILTKLLDALIPTARNKSTTHEDKPEKRFCLRFGLRYEEPIIRIRPLDKTLPGWGGFRDISVPLSDLAVQLQEVSQVVIVENLISFLTLPPIKNCLAIWGSGFGVTRLKAIPWFPNCTLYYWGDIDVSGLSILSQIRRIFPKIIPVMIDQDTLDQFESFSDTLKDPQKADQVLLDHLTLSEQALFAHVRDRQLQLEQEQIPMGYVRAQWEEATRMNTNNESD